MTLTPPALSTPASVITAGAALLADAVAAQGVATTRRRHRPPTWPR